MLLKTVICIIETIPSDITKINFDRKAMKLTHTFLSNTVIRELILKGLKRTVFFS